MKEKIKSALKQKYSNTGLGDDVMDGVAEILSHNVKEESQIDTAVAGCEGLLKGVQGSLDRERNARSEAEKRLKALTEQAEAEQKQKQPEAELTTPNGDMDKKTKEPTREIQELRALLANLAKQVTEMTQANTQKSKLEQLTATLKEQKVPEAYYTPIISGRTFGEDFDVDTYATKVHNGWQAVEKELAGKRFDGVNPPDKGDPDGNNVSDPLAKLIQQGTDALSSK